MSKANKSFGLLAAVLLLFPCISAQQKLRGINSSPKAANTAKPDDSCVGQYLFPDGIERILTITKSGNKLIAANSWRKYELFPQSRDKFTYKIEGVGTASITFIRDVSGRVPQLMYTLFENTPHPKKTIATRISSTVPYFPSPQKLMEYVGRYGSVTFTVNNSVDGSELFGEESGRRKVGLFPDSEDRFLSKADPKSITFTRNARGKITHVVFEGDGRKTTVPKM